MACGDDRITQLNKKLKDLQEDHLRLLEDNAAIKNQLKARDDETNRLRSLIEGNQAPNQVSKDSCYKNIDSQIVILQDEITRFKKERNNLELQVKEALAKQHEAMRRALHLAERNKELEKEMKELDEVALAVESQCNGRVKCSLEKVARLQDRINESLILIHNLERDNAKLKQFKDELSADLNAIKLEKVHLQKRLDKEIEDKKTLINKINCFTVIENDLNLEIDRLTKLSTEQKRKITELESQRVCKKSVSTKSRPCSSKTENAELLQKCCCESGNCIKNLKELLDREVEYRQVHAKQSMEDLRQEKEYYMKEYHRVLEQMRNIPSNEISENDILQLKQQLKDKENQIKRLEDDVRQLNKEKSALLAGEMQGMAINRGSCGNPNCKSKERELEVKSNELQHLEIESNMLKSKLQAVNETTVFNEERMKRAFKDMEEHIRKLEDERRDLVKTELTHRSNVSQLEEEHRNVKDQLKQTLNELSNLRANYNQLKLLHEQTDRALSETQAQVIQAETELATYKARTSRDNVAQDGEIAKLTSDIQIMKNQLNKLEREKDDLMNKLDEKTEKHAVLEEELCAKNNLVSKLENDLKELNRKLGKYASESSSQDHIVRTKQQELDLLNRDYDKEKRLKEAAMLENKRLQNDLTSVTCDCRDARDKLELCRRQVEDLKRQLQHYVAEVKRTEDLISQKEVERNELFDQFRCLSQEANILESSNHTLETLATQSKIQLSVALDHTTELERKIEHQESIIRSYEKQIADLTQQVARLEVHLKENGLELKQCNAEMKQMRDLCIKLDKDKDSLKKQLLTVDSKRINEGSNLIKTKIVIESDDDEQRNEAIDQNRPREANENLFSRSQQLAMDVPDMINLNSLNEELEKTSQ